MRSLLLCGTMALAGLLALPAPAPALLGISVSTAPGLLTPFAPGSTATTSGVLTVSGSGILSPWTLTISDTSSGSPAPGHLVRSSACTLGVPYLAQPLAIKATPPAGAGYTSTGSQNLSATPVMVATGPASLVSLVTVDFRQVIGVTEALRQGCGYSVSVTFTVS
jgi:hypothetical protein